MKLPDFQSITFDPIGGTHIVDSQREAIAIAVEHRCDVRFEHNELLFEVKYTDLIQCVIEQGKAK